MNLSRKDRQELENAMNATHKACKKLQKKVPYASTLYDAADDVIRRSKELLNEAAAS